ncbi:UNVERIFIED_CONTAM: hypothetical protein K2H54_056971 [Gekko kuhli]
MATACMMDSYVNTGPILIVASGAVEQLRKFQTPGAQALMLSHGLSSVVHPEWEPRSGQHPKPEMAKEGLQGLLQELLREDLSAGHLVGLLDVSVWERRQW